MLSQTYKFLKPSTYRFSLRMAEKSTKIPDTFSKVGQRDYLEENLPPELFNILMNKTTEYRNWMKSHEVTLYEKIQTYKIGYVEKAVLLDKATAERIVDSVLVHSRGDKTTTFFDGEGGICQIAAMVSKSDMFKTVCVLEKDMCLSTLHEYAKSDYLDPNIPVYDVNFTKISSNFLHEKGKYISPFLKYIPQGKVSEEVPSYTMVSSASHGFVKYLTTRMLHRDNPFGEFFSSRPEFFLVVNARTYIHLCCGIDELDPSHERLTEEEMRLKTKLIKLNPVQTQPYNIMFQVYFDFCLIDVLPKHAYFPWKGHKRHYNPLGKTSKKKPVQSMDKLYENRHDKLMLIYVRPKKQEEVDINPVYFSYFLTRLLRTRTRAVVEMFEEWSVGWGFGLVEEGLTIFTLVKDLDVDGIIELYTYLLNIPDFERSSFASEAVIHNEDNIESNEVDETELERFRIKLDRKMLSGADLNESIYDSN